MGVKFTFAGQQNNRAGGGRFWVDNSQSSGGGGVTEKPQTQAPQNAPQSPAPAIKRPEPPEEEDTSPDTAAAMYKHFHKDELELRAKQMADDAIANARMRQNLANQRAEIDKVAGLRGFNTPINKLAGFDTPINQLKGFDTPINQLKGFNSPINQLTSGSSAPVLRIGDTVEDHIKLAEASSQRQHARGVSTRYRRRKNQNDGVLADARRVVNGDHMGGAGMFVVGPQNYSNSTIFKGGHVMFGTFTAGKAGHPVGQNNDEVMQRSMNRMFWSSYPGGAGSGLMS